MQTDSRGYAVAKGQLWEQLGCETVKAAVHKVKAGCDNEACKRWRQTDKGQAAQQRRQQGMVRAGSWFGNSAGNRQFSRQSGMNAPMSNTPSAVTLLQAAAGSAAGGQGSQLARQGDTPQVRSCKSHGPRLWH
jgi:hypothetical protein